MRELRSSADSKMGITGSSGPIGVLDRRVYDAVNSFIILLFWIVIAVTVTESTMTVSLKVRFNHPVLTSSTNDIRAGGLESSVKLETGRAVA